MTLTSGVSWNITTSTPHGLFTGGTVALANIVSTGANPNGVYDSAVVVTGANTFTLATASVGAFSFTSGINSVTDLSN
jgi:hypothetical protein